MCSSDLLVTLGLLTQKGMSHIAHNTAALSMMNRGYIVDQNSPVRMDLRLVTTETERMENGRWVSVNEPRGITVASSCNVFTLKPVDPRSPSLTSHSEPLITFKNEIRLPVVLGTLQYGYQCDVERDGKVARADQLACEPGVLMIKVGASALENEVLKEMSELVSPVEHDDFDTLSDQVIRSSSLPTDENKHLRRRILDRYELLQGSGNIKPFKTLVNRDQLKILDRALACLQSPTEKAIEGLKSKMEKGKYEEIAPLLQEVINQVEKQSPSPTSSTPRVP